MTTLVENTQSQKMGATPAGAPKGGGRVLTRNTDSDVGLAHLGQKRGSAACKHRSVVLPVLSVSFVPTMKLNGKFKQ